MVCFKNNYFNYVKTHKIDIYYLLNVKLIVGFAFRFFIFISFMKIIKSNRKGALLQSKGINNNCKLVVYNNVLNYLI